MHSRGGALRALGQHNVGVGGHFAESLILELTRFGSGKGSVINIHFDSFQVEWCCSREFNTGGGARAALSIQEGMFAKVCATTDSTAGSHQSSRNQCQDDRQGLKD